LLPTSNAESAVMAFLRAEPSRYLHKRLLHIGVGNSSLPTEFGPSLAGYVGITISLPELALFETRFARSKKLKAILLNKYDPRMYNKIDGEFDLIIDTLLKSYACCEKHFEAMIGFFVTKLRSGGSLITTENGVLWGWRGNTGRAYTPGAQLDPLVAEFRKLGRDGLWRLGERLGLTMSSTRDVRPLHGEQELADGILMLSK
jgi:hypothetical protein